MKSLIKILLFILKLLFACLIVMVVYCQKSGYILETITALILSVIFGFALYKMQAVRRDLLS
jgi:hypothetical protein